MKQHHNQQQQQQPMNGVHGGPSPIETKWWYKGPDGETYGPYTSREMRTWGNSGYFNDSLPVRTENDEMFHPIGDWTSVMGGANPFANPSVPAFHVLAHAAHAQQQFLLYPPGLQPPAPFNAGAPPPPTNGGPQQQQQRFNGPPFMPNGAPPPAAAAAAMANLHLGGGGGHMGMMQPMHLGGPLSQPPSEPNDGANSSNSHTPDSAEPDFRSLHQMSGMPPPVPAMHGARMQFGYGMPPMQQHQPQQQQQQQHAMAAAPTHNGLFTRMTTTQDAPWNSRREIGIDANQQLVKRNTIATQTLPVIIGSKDASRLLSDLTGCSIVIT